MTINLYFDYKFLRRFFTFTENFYFDNNFYGGFLRLLRNYVFTMNFYCEFLRLLWNYVFTMNFYCEFLLLLQSFFVLQSFFSYCKVFLLWTISGILRHNCAREPTYLIVVICAAPEWHVIQCVQMCKVRKSCMSHKIIGMKIDRWRIHYSALHTNVQIHLIQFHIACDTVDYAIAKKV